MTGLLREVTYGLGEDVCKKRYQSVSRRILLTQSANVGPCVSPVLPQKDVYGREKKQQNYHDEGDAYRNLSLSLVGRWENTPQKLRD